MGTAAFGKSHNYTEKNPPGIIVSLKIESAVDVFIHLMYYYLSLYTIQMNLWKRGTEWMKYLRMTAIGLFAMAIGLFVVCRAWH